MYHSRPGNPAKGIAPTVQGPQKDHCRHFVSYRRTKVRPMDDKGGRRLAICWLILKGVSQPVVRVVWLSGRGGFDPRTRFCPWKGGRESHAFFSSRRPLG